MSPHSILWIPLFDDRIAKKYINKLYSFYNILYYISLFNSCICGHISTLFLIGLIEFLKRIIKWFLKLFLRVDDTMKLVQQSVAVH